VPPTGPELLRPIFDRESGRAQVCRFWTHEVRYRVPTVVALTVPPDQREAVGSGFREVEAALLAWADGFQLREDWFLHQALASPPRLPPRGCRNPLVYRFSGTHIAAE
jgi:hypothetical protein